MDPPVLDAAWVKRHRDRTPSISDRVLMFLCELILRDGTGKPGHFGADRERAQDLLKAAGGCQTDHDLSQLFHHTGDQGWTTTRGIAGMVPFAINLSGRMHVEKQLRDLGSDRNGFVAMWFDDSMEEVCENGIAPAIEDAGYNSVRIDRQEFLGKVDDEIVDQIRQSRFVVADFTTSEASGARSGVCYEAGFAYGLGIPVIYTCRQDRMKAVHFDTNHFNHITWETSEDLRTQLHRRIEAT